MAAAAAIAVVVGVAGALVWEERQQAGILAERAQETEFLAQTVRSLKVRLDAIDAAQIARRSDRFAPFGRRHEIDRRFDARVQ